MALVLSEFIRKGGGWLLAAIVVSCFVWFSARKQGELLARQESDREIACIVQGINDKIKRIEDAHDSIDLDIDPDVVRRRLREGAATVVVRKGDCD